LEEIEQTTGTIEDEQNVLKELLSRKQMQGLDSKETNFYNAIIYRCGLKKILQKAITHVSKKQEEFMNQQHIQDLIQELQNAELEEGE
jgi:hypothetical protein